jgi:hypothetical protein
LKRNSTYGRNRVKERGKDTFSSGRQSGLPHELLVIQDC